MRKFHLVIAYVIKWVSILPFFGAIVLSWILYFSGAFTDFNGGILGEFINQIILMISGLIAAGVVLFIVGHRWSKKLLFKNQLMSQYINEQKVEELEIKANEARDLI